MISKDSHFRTEFGSSFHSFGAVLKKILPPYCKGLVLRRQRRFFDDERRLLLGVWLETN